MTSEFHKGQCYVYITLPGQTEQVTAGRFTVTTDRSGIPVGRFIYGRRYRDRPDAVELDPVELLLGDRVYETITMNGVFGALRDAGPDYWGRRIIERHLQKPELDELDYLLYSPDDRAGAIGFGLGKEPPAPRRIFNQTIDLEKLQTIADSLVRQEHDETGTSSLTVEQTQALLLLGTSMGGARPKAVVQDSEGLWVAKFNRLDDKFNQARVEHSMLVLARSCGINTAHSKLTTVGDRDVLLVKRFDREKTANGYLRARMVSGLTLLRASDSHRSRHQWSYILLAEELRRVCTEPQKQAIELFKRMCFNALISNTDDHPRNHAVIAKDKQWRLSPAYDLTPTSPVSIERRDLALIVGDHGRYANAQNLLTQCERFFLQAEQARDIINQMQQQVQNTWLDVMRSQGVTQRDCELLKGAFNYQGFSTSPSP